MGLSTVMATLQDAEFRQFRDLMYQAAGISLSDAKKALVAGRLWRRLQHHGLVTYGDYYSLLAERDDERQIAIDLLTTNETYFFREPNHFEFLKSHVLPGQPRNRPLRVWSAACSSGEEPFSIAMLLADHFTGGWEVLGSDISQRVLERARRGLYRLDGVRGLSESLLHKHCLKGIGAHEGMFLIDPCLLARVSFTTVNLNKPLPEIGEFDVIFLRNVMIYFQAEIKRQVLTRVMTRLRSGGTLFIGHAESLTGLVEGLTALAPAVYRKP
jgi:chemotaxis protein methyltransferase CheR